MGQGVGGQQASELFLDAPGGGELVGAVIGAAHVIEPFPSRGGEGVVAAALVLRARYGGERSVNSGVAAGAA
ncbi:hypothetical protein DAD186_20830 [Dermabacter vaginalis]|uniref:Uncharacterized protein n=1 Tax=Dermabacter vaginalis TaxID=1630135 RepID=A0A1B0ZL28_9MICO|nr:hypothetical protein DAD186_20830 [Dermabacter vaginalis]